MKLLALLIFIIPAVTAVENEQTPRGKPIPLVLWHGMGDSCCIPVTAGLYSIFLAKKLGWDYVYSMRIGDSNKEQLDKSYFMDPNAQVEYACKQLKNNVDMEKAKDGFNMIGLGQGSLFLRAVIQRCGHELAPIKNLISLGGPHQGIHGLPRCMSLALETCGHMKNLLNSSPYDPAVQRALVPATYWHDPFQEYEYKYKSIFLSDINNEVIINETYRTNYCKETVKLLNLCRSNLKKLEHFVMVKFEHDTVVQPRESAWFGYHAPGREKIQTLQQSAIYFEDRLGLKEMEKAGKLVFLSHPSDHLEVDEQWFLDNIMPYLVKNQTNVTINTIFN